MARTTNFSVGRQYRCVPDPIKNRESFHFVVIGKGHNDNHKLCFLWVRPEDRLPTGLTSTHRSFQTYPHNHLRKHGTLLEEIVEPLAFEHEGKKYHLVVDEPDYGRQELTLFLGDTIVAKGTSTSFSDRDPFGRPQTKARLSTGTVVANPLRYRGALYRGALYEKSYDLSFYAWKAWIKDILGAEVTFPFIEE